jgi:hypothetical protein
MHDNRPSEGSATTRHVFYRKAAKRAKKAKENNKTEKNPWF